MRVRPGGGATERGPGGGGGGGGYSSTIIATQNGLLQQLTHLHILLSTLGAIKYKTNRRQCMPEPLSRCRRRRRRRRRATLHLPPQCSAAIVHHSYPPCTRRPATTPPRHRATAPPYLSPRWIAGPLGLRRAPVHALQHRHCSAVLPPCQYATAVSPLPPPGRCAAAPSCR